MEPTAATERMAVMVLAERMAVTARMVAMARTVVTEHTVAMARMGGTGAEQRSKLCS